MFVKSPKSMLVSRDLIYSRRVENGIQPLKGATLADGSSSVSVFENGRLISVRMIAADETQLSGTIYGYDAHGRLKTETDVRNGTTTYGYDAADRLVKTTTPIPGPGEAAQVTQYGYDAMGRRNLVIHPDGSQTDSEYFPNGSLKKTWGSKTFPVEYTYDSQGRVRTMTSWQDFGEASSEAVTEWQYDASRGFLAKKIYPAPGAGGGKMEVTYSYTDAGRLKSRTWARGVVTTYSYNDVGDLSGIVYTNDPAGTPPVTLTYDRLGYLSEVTD